MDNIAYKYNRFLLVLVAISPFVSYVIWNMMGVTHGRVLQLLSYIGVLLLIVLSNSKNPIKIPTYLIFYFLFILYVFYSAFWQLDRDFKINYLFSNSLIGGFNMLFIIENLPISKKFYNYIFRLSKNILIIAFIVIIYQQTVDNDFYMLNDEELDSSFLAGDSKIRLKSIYSYLGYIAFGFGFVPIFFWVVESLLKEKKKILIWLFIGIVFAFLTKSRWVMLNALLVFAILIIHNKNRVLQTIKLLLIIPFFALLTYSSLSAVGIDVGKIVNDRILESDKKNKSATTRILAFKVFDKLYWDNAIFGIGSIKYGMGATGENDYKLRREFALNKRKSAQIHVGYLSVLYRYGVIGGGLFFTFLYLFLKKMYKNAKLTNNWAPFLGILGFAMANLTLVTFSVFEMGIVIVFFADKFHITNRNNSEKLNAK